MDHWVSIRSQTSLNPVAFLQAALTAEADTLLLSLYLFIISRLSACAYLGGAKCHIAIFELAKVFKLKDMVDPFMHVQFTYLYQSMLESNCEDHHCDCADYMNTLAFKIAFDPYFLVLPDDRLCIAKKIAPYGEPRLCQNCSNNLEELLEEVRDKVWDDIASILEHHR